MMEPITIVVPGTPRPKGRPRFSGKTNTTYTPAGTRQYELTVGRLASLEMRGRDLFHGPLHLDMKAHFPIPVSWPPKKREAALRGEIRPTGKPDLTNVAKAIEDGLLKIVYDDDACIVSASFSKVYAAGEPFVVATVKPVATALTPTQESARN